jgi:O-antigen/teichoic acid export membrane protein|tara:strand:+ start:514 stop:1647 length:1134 start_codon:yes stop_codon:yes gene_type:complete
MGIFRNNHGLRDMSTIGIASIVGSAISAIFWIYLAALMGAENYGELGYYISIASIVTSLSFIGGPAAITVLVAKKIKIESTIYLVSILATVISAIVLYFAFINIGLSIYVLGAVIYNLSVSELLGRKSYRKYSIYFILQKILFVVLSLILYYVMGPTGVLLGTGLSFMPFLIQIYSGFKNQKIDFKLLKTKWQFITNNFFIDLSVILNNQIDRLIIGPIFGFTILGNYYLALQVLNVLSILPEIVKKYTMPEDSSGVNTTKIKIITIGFSIILALIGVLIIPKVIPIFFPEFKQSIELIPLISLTIIPATISGLYNSKFLAHEKSNYVVIVNIISTSVLVLGVVILGQLLGIVGLAYSFLLANSIKAVLYFSLNKKV